MGQVSRAVVLSGVRTPIGRYGGALSGERPDDLAGLVIAGEHDPTAGPSHASLLAESIPDASLVVLSDAAHMAHVEQANEWNDAVLEFLR